MADFWSSTRFLVTGASGFLGGHLIPAMQARGAWGPHLARQADADLRDADAVRALLHKVRPDVIVHLAANVGGIGANRARPADFFYDNMAMGLHLIHQAAIRGIQKFVMIGTVCAYPKFTPVPFRESDLWDGYPEETNAPYGVAKKALLVMGQAYRAQYGLNAIHLLPTNLYGPGDHFAPATSHVIPALIRKAILGVERGEPELVVWGTGAARREFLYAADAAEGICRAVELYDSPEPLNLGSGQEIRIGDLAAMIVALTGYRGNLRWDASQPDGQPRRCLDTSRAADLLGWRATMPLGEGLRHTIEYFLALRQQERTVA